MIKTMRTTRKVDDALGSSTGEGVSGSVQIQELFVVALLLLLMPAIIDISIKKCLLPGSQTYHFYIITDMYLHLV
jgi:hypothetical protein